MLELEVMDEDSSEIHVDNYVAEKICRCLFRKYNAEKLMEIVRQNNGSNIFIVVNKKRPSRVRVVVDRHGRYRYCSGERLCIPIPKKFAVLEPDINYFEMTVKANVFLAVVGVEEKDLHR
jgi:hypothetical protein